MSQAVTKTIDQLMQANEAHHRQIEEAEVVIRDLRASEAAHSDGPRQGGRHRILVVDDNRDSADSLAMLLKVMGHEVSTAYGGEEAVEAGAAFVPDVVLLDIAMPTLNGYETCLLIREQPWGKAAFLIALTGWGQAGDRLRSEQTGFDAHMVKPADAALLLKTLAARPAPG